MEARINKKILLEAIIEQLQCADIDTLEAIIELLEDKEDIRDARIELENTRINGTISYEKYKHEVG